MERKKSSRWREVRDSVLVNEKTRLLVQGFTGREGTFHAQQMIEYGTNVVGGVTPGKAARSILSGRCLTRCGSGEATGADASVFFAAAVFGRCDFGSGGSQLRVVCITEGIPTLDMVRVAKC